MRLVDAAKWDLLTEEHDMTVPDDFPLGTYTVEGQIEDEVGNLTTVTLILVVTGDRVGPELTITGVIDDGDLMAGDLGTGYILETTNVPAIDHLIQFADGTDANEPLADEYFGLSLVDSTVSAVDLEAYYIARGVPEPYLSYLIDAAYGNEPFVYIKGTTVRLVDAAKWDLLAEEHDMTVPDDFPLGTYTVEGQIEDEAGNPTTVTLILVVDDLTEPTLESVTPPEGEFVVSPSGTFVWVVDAADSRHNLYELEVDHSMENNPATPEFSVFASESDPYGGEGDLFAAAGVTVTYDAAEEKWTIDFGETITNLILDNGGITFYVVIKDDAGNVWGSMDPTTSENTFIYRGPADGVIVDIDHEEGILSGDWESDNGGGYIGVSAGAALAGTDYGLWADSGEGTSQYAYLHFPQVDTDTLRLRFYIDVQNVTPADGYLHIIGVKSYNEQEHICYIRLRYNGLQYYIQFDVKEDGDIDYPLYSAAGSISASAENYVEVMIVRGSDNDGEAYLWVNGVLEDSATDIDNDQQFTNLGFIEAGTFAKNGLWAGNVHFDEIIMNITGDEIGSLTE